MIKASKELPVSQQCGTMNNLSWLDVTTTKRSSVSQFLHLRNSADNIAVRTLVILFPYFLEKNSVYKFTQISCALAQSLLQDAVHRSQEEPVSKTYTLMTFPLMLAM